MAGDHFLGEVVAGDHFESPHDTGFVKMIPGNHPPSPVTNIAPVQHPAVPSPTQVARRRQSH
ncbi:MAG: hypothetical protein NT117_12630, partial [Gammaproteobacteria bacterium]|nr:hypothetical protein [Gammaproteobacteria bacterium]